MSQDGTLKLYESLKMKERIAIQRNMAVSLSEAITEGSEYAEELLCELIYVASRRLNRDDITRESIGELTGDGMVELLEEMTKELGYEVEEEEEVPLVQKTTSSVDKLETQNSTTDTTTVS